MIFLIGINWMPVLHHKDMENSVDIRQNIVLHVKLNCSFMTPKKCPFDILQTKPLYRFYIFRRQEILREVHTKI